MVNYITKTKYLLYAFKYKKRSNFDYYYETDASYFKESRPPKTILDKQSEEVENLHGKKIILNPWNEWGSNNIQKIITSNGICINYLKSTDGEYIQKQEDLKLLRNGMKIFLPIFILLQENLELWL